MLLCLVIVFSFGLLGCDSEAEKQAAIEKQKQQEIEKQKQDEKAWQEKIVGKELAKTKGNKRY